MQKFRLLNIVMVTEGNGSLSLPPEANSKPYQTSKIECFARIVKYF